jgi:hypothetical protein
VTADWRKLHSEELHNLYFSPSIIRIPSRSMRLAARVERMRNAYKILNWKTKIKMQLRIYRLRWEDNIEMVKVFTACSASITMFRVLRLFLLSG